MAEEEEVVEPLHLDFEDREVYLAKIPVRHAVDCLYMTARTDEMTAWSLADGARRGVEERARCCSSAVALGCRTAH